MRTLETTKKTYIDRETYEESCKESEKWKEQMVKLEQECIKVCCFTFMLLQTVKLWMLLIVE